MVKNNEKPPVPPTRWPEAAPSPDEEKIISISVGNTHISWAIHEGVAQKIVPTLFWRTPHVKPDEARAAKKGTSCEILSTYLSDGARTLLFGSKSADTTMESAICASTKRRVSLVSIYIVSTNDAQLATLAALLRHVPCRMYLMQGDDFFTSEQGRYSGIGIDRLANLRAAGDFKGFPALVVDGGTAMTYTAADKEGKVLGGGIGPGVQVKLQSLSDYASALPYLSMDSIMKELAGLTDDKGATLKTLPVFARTPKQNIITNLCREIACTGQSVIASFLGTFEGVPVDKINNGGDATTPNNNGDKEKKYNTSRLVHVTGGDADLIAKLLVPDCSDLIELDPTKKIPTTEKYKVKKMKHMIHYGIAGAVREKADEFKESPTAAMDTLLVGQRIAKKFPQSDGDGDFIYRGTVSCVHGAKPKYPYGIRYDDGDSEDLTVVELYEALELYIKVGEKDVEAGESSKESSQPPRGEKIVGAQKAAIGLAQKDELVRASIAKKAQPKKAPPPKKTTPPPPKKTTPPPPTKPAESESASKRPQKDETPAPRKKAKKSPTKLTKPDKEYKGDRIAKIFEDGKMYFGTVGDVWYDSDEEENLWRIDYDDGDNEDLGRDDFIVSVQLYGKEKANDPKKK